MPLNPGEQFSGGKARDADGRTVIVIVTNTGGVGAEQFSGGWKRDADGRRVVVLVNAS